MDFRHLGAVWERLAVARRAFLVGIDHYGIPQDHSDLASILADRDYRPALLSVGTSEPVPERNAIRSRRTKGVDKSALTLPEPRRVRDREHLRSVAQKACLVCGRKPSDPHHLRFAQTRAMGQKVSDEFTVPLCRGHHREVHRSGDEATWWDRQGIDPTPAARTLWLESHPLPDINSSVAAASDDTVSSQISRSGVPSKVIEFRPHDHDSPSRQFHSALRPVGTRKTNSRLSGGGKFLPATHRAFTNSAKKVSTSETGSVTENELVCDARFASGDALLWPDAANQVHSTPVSTTRGRLAA